MVHKRGEKGPEKSMSLTEVLSPEKRAQIMTGAAAVFAQDGYEGASMSRIAAEANVSKGTLYNYFESKAALFAAYVSQQCERFLAQVFGDADAEAEPAEVLRSIGLRMLEMMMSPVGLTVYRVVVSEAGKFPNLAQTFFEAGPARAIGQMAAYLAAATARGKLSVDDPEFAAEQFFQLCQTRLGLRRRLLLIDEASPEEIKRVVDAAVTMFLLQYGPASMRIRPGSQAES
jgi:TetR/AcrR family transcriptional repressor of mexJK operon